MATWRIIHSGLGEQPVTDILTDETIEFEAEYEGDAAKEALRLLSYELSKVE